jgi:hypothetical protein
MGTGLPRWPYDLAKGKIISSVVPPGETHKIVILRLCDLDETAGIALDERVREHRAARSGWSASAPDSWSLGNGERLVLQHVADELIAVAVPLLDHES